MNNRQIFIATFLIACLLFVPKSYGQDASTLKPEINKWLKKCKTEFPNIGNFKVKKIECNNSKKTLKIVFASNFGSIPFRPELNAKLRHEVDSVVSKQCKNYKISLFVDAKNIDELVPNFYRTTPDKSRMSKTNVQGTQFVTNKSKPFEAKQGLTGRNIALWHSHGWYYESKLDRWEWQRARLFQTVEDKYTMSYVLPYLVPMLENAGAHVLMPRERDFQTAEVIVDNDQNSQGSIYREKGKKNEFRSGGDSGFAHKRETYVEEQNPFAEGTYRTVATGKEEGATVEWIPNIPKNGFYNVSIAYKSKAESASDARYTVYHTGGKTEFTVDQTMGGGTWIYLGNFYFEAGVNEDFGKVVLSNLSDFSNKIVTADAVRFGGGMGNIARKPKAETTTENIKSSSDEKAATVKTFVKDDSETSRRARYLEGARYWLQWAGVPFKVYSPTNGENDYTDDFTCRGLWVNWLNNGSVNQPDSVGLGIPIDMSLAFHTDAGQRTNDTIIGTLGIYSTKRETSSKTQFFPNGQSRYASRDLLDLVMSEITNDIRRVYEPNWARRGMWNSAYKECAYPDVPSMILELLSHHNFYDMKYGLDPRFQFLVSRAVYKAITRFIAAQNGTSYQIQPLAVSQFSAEFVANGDSVRLRWQPTIDTLERTAVAENFVVYTRIDGKGFDNGILVKNAETTLPIEKNKIYSYKITAVNGGGESFPSEILSVCKTSTDKPTLLVVNGFDRVSAPGSFEAGNFGGFADWLDQGVPYIQNISYIGAQTEMRRDVPWTDDDSSGFGSSNSDYETQIIAGNTFDFPYTHGKAMQNSGYSFVSASVAAVESGDVALENYPAIDLVLGEQKKTYIGRGTSGCKFKTFSVNLQNRISAYCKQGGNIFVSGANVASDLWFNGEIDAADLVFAKEILKYIWRTDRASQDGKVMAVFAPNSHFSGNFDFCTQLNDQQYAVESPDGIEPYGNDAYTVFRYANSISAGVAYKGNDYRTVVCGFPFEALTSDEQRAELMRQIAKFLLP